MSSWPVLLVDDEPDVLAISKLAMKNFTVYGLPLDLYTAASKAEAETVLNSELGMQGKLSPLAVAIIDVVMESDSAGLELCDSIRFTRHNHMTQLFIRTGQPGTAPERTVIDRYDINGYYTKTELSEDKLYSMIKSGIRQYYSARSSLSIAELTNRLTVSAEDREKMIAFIKSLGTLANSDNNLPESLSGEAQHFTFVNGAPIGGTFAEAEAEALRQRLEGIDGTTLGPTGDQYAADEDHYCYLKIDGRKDRAEVVYISKRHFPTPDVVLASIHAFWSSFARLWHFSP